MTSHRFPWREGFWKIKDMTAYLCIIEGENIDLKKTYCLDYPNATSFMKSKLVTGDFGPTTPEIRALTGVDTYNVQWETELWNTKTPGVLSKEGTCIHKNRFGRSGIDILEYLDDTQLKALKDNRDSVEAPTLPPYIKPTPEHLGKILWLSGPPGSGKSTTAQLIGRNHGYVYYEADCFCNCVNPFIDIHEESPSYSAMNQKPLKGRTDEEIKMIEETKDIGEDIQKGMFDDLEEKMNPALIAVTNDIAKLRQRIGGDWAIAWACYTRAQRDQIRQILGSNLVFIVLKMTENCVYKRLSSRHGGSTEIINVMGKMHQLFEDAGDDEMMAYNLIINEDMSEDEVVAEVLKIVQNV